MTAPIDDWEPTDDDDPRAPPKSNGRPSNVRHVERVTTASGYVVVVDDGPDAWERGMITDAKGVFLKRSANCAHVLSRHPEWRGVIAFDTFAERVITTRVPPMREQDRPVSQRAGEWTDADSARTAQWIQATIGFDASAGMVDGVLRAVAERQVVHPVRDYFDRCAAMWDHVPRVDTWMSTYLGTPDGQYERAVGACMLIAGVARIYSPGCKVDTIPTLEGPQGILKSTALRTLVSDPWFSDTPFDLHSKDAYIALRGKLLIELAELAAVRGKDVEKIKAFFSRPVDSYREPFAKRNIDVPRQNIFAATLNPDNAGYLVDVTGNRRFLPVRCGRVDVDAIARDRDLLWGEAVHKYRAGVQHWFSADVERLAREEQADRETTDAWHDTIAAYVAGRPSVTVPELLGTALGIDKVKWTPNDQQRVGRIMSQLRWTRDRPWVTDPDGIRRRRYQLVPPVLEGEP